MDLKDIGEVRTVEREREANELLANGWVLLEKRDVEQKVRHECLPFPSFITVTEYFLGKPRRQSSAGMASAMASRKTTPRS